MFILRKVTKVYNSSGVKNIALKGIDIEFPEKGLVVLLGKSGCGKSTLLNILGGLDKATTGEVSVDGKMMAHLKGSKLDAFRNSYVGYIFQEFNLIDELSVHDNIEMTLRLQDKKDKYMAVDDALEMVGLHNLGHRKPSELSGGQRQRVAIARALIKNSEVLLADEPTGSLDSNTGTEVFETLKRIAKDKLVIIVTHDSEMAYSYASRVIELSDGLVVSDVTKRASDEKFIRTLSKNVIEVSQGEELSLETINDCLSDNEVNFIGINYDLDRVTLAYPEILDTLEQKKQNSNYSQTLDEDIAKREPRFNLKKGKLSMKYAFGLAKKSIALRKRRLRVLITLSSIGFTFTLFALILPIFSTNSLLQRTFWADEALPVMRVSKLDDWGWSQDIITSSDMNEIQDIMDVDNVGIQRSIELTPVFANPQPEWTNNEFIFSGFQSIIQGISSSDLGLKLTHGSDLIEATDIIISDYAAFFLLREGFLGYNSQGIFGVHFFDNESQLVNSRITLSGSDQLFRVAGIFETNFREFLWLLSTPSELFTSNKQWQLLEAFKRNKELYTTIITTQGVKFQSTLSADVWGEFSSMQVDGVIVNNNSNNLEILKDQMLYSQADINNLPKSVRENQDIPTSLHNNQVVVSMSVFRKMFRFNQDRLTEPDIDLTDQQMISRILDANPRFYVRFSRSGFTLDIVDVLDTEEQIFLLSNNYVERILSSEQNVEGIYEVLVARGNQQDFLNRVNALIDAGFLPVPSFMDFWQFNTSLTVIQEASTPLLIVGVIFLTFSFFISLNFIMISVRIRKKELLVYKVLGAKNTDLAKIFFAEWLYLAIRITIGSAIGVLSFMWMFNMGSGFIPMLHFSIWYIPMFFLFIGLFLGITVFLPVRTVISKKPSEAMKLV